MNARATSFEFTCLGKKVNEITSALFHSIIFNRCFGKFKYGSENGFSVGTMGWEEILCDFIDFTYIRVSSADLVRSIDHDTRKFVDQLRSAAYMSSNNPSTTSPPSSYSSSPPKFSTSPSSHFYSGGAPGYLSSSPPSDGFLSSMAQNGATGTISLEFFIRSSRSKWSFAEPLVWEVWTLKFNCLKDEVSEEPYNTKASLEDQLFDKMLSIVQIVNTSQYIPPMPSQSEVDNIFDTNYLDVQPYNFKISYKIGSGQIQEPTNRTRMDRGSTPHVIKNFLKQKLAL